MSVEIPVKRIAVDDKHILEFIVTDPFTIHFILMADKDPTLVDTNYITIASDDCYRGGEVDEDSGELIESSLEPLSDFCQRAAEEAEAFAQEELDQYRQQQQLAAELGKVLPKGI